MRANPCSGLGWESGRSRRCCSLGSGIRGCHSHAFALPIHNAARSLPEAWADNVPDAATLGLAPYTRSHALGVIRLMKKKTSDLSLDLYEQPGHLIRRAHQIAVSMFHEELGRDVTPVQYAVLRMLQETPGIDQVTLALKVGLDNSTAADIARRLEVKGWIVRELMPRRQRRLSLTEDGTRVLSGFLTGIYRLQDNMLSSLDASEQSELIRLLQKFVHINNDQSRAPVRPG